MNVTETRQPTGTIVMCMTFPVLLLLCVCCIICLTVKRRKALPQATVIVPVAVVLTNTKEVPPIP